MSARGTCTRRGLLATAIASGAASAFPGIVIARGEAPATQQAGLPERTLRLFNTHTREEVHVVLRRGDAYLPEAIAQLRHVLRDHRNGESHDMDLGLYEQLCDLAATAKVDPYYQIISGYRSPESNAKMVSPGSGVAKNSLHMQGKAIDVRLVNFSTAELRDLALAAEKGGVGYYKRSDFVHLDTGRFRSWIG